MRTRRTATITELRLAIDGLPLQTRIAMLDGIRSNQIIVGAYTSADGICPMLAAHRAGGRTSFIAFAKAWDRFAFRGTRKCTARRASKRELLVLRAHLEASLLEEDGPGPELAEAIREHRELTRRACEPGRADRTDRTRPNHRQRRHRPQRRAGQASRLVVDAHHAPLRRVRAGPDASAGRRSVDLDAGSRARQRLTRGARVAAAGRDT